MGQQNQPTVCTARAAVVIAGLSLFVAALAVSAVVYQRSAIADLHHRLRTVETHPQYQGKDANGDEVWAPAVTVVKLPVK